MITASAEQKATQQQPSAESQLPFAANVPAAEAWLAQLSSQGFGDACRNLFNALRTMNRVNIPVHQRLQFLETLRPRIIEFSRRFDTYFVEQTFPLDDKIARVVRLAAQFQAELAMGYQRVINDPASAEVFNKAQQSVAAHRALSAFGLFMLRSAQSYEALTANLWSNIYDVYRRAEFLGIAHESVIDLDCGLATSATSSECLRKIALFQLAQPMRLPQREIAELYAWLDENTHLAGLHRERAFNLQEAHFYLNLSGNSAPQPIGALSDPGAETRYLFLDPMLLELLSSSASCSAFGLSVALRLTPGKESWQDSGETTPVLFATGVEGCSALLKANIATVRRRVNGLESTPIGLAHDPMDSRGTLTARATRSMPAKPALLPQVSRDDIWGGTDPETIAASHGKPGLVCFYDNKARAGLIADRQSFCVGQLLTIASENVKAAIGVVRAISTTNDATRIWADVEILAGAATAAHAYIEGEKRRRLPCVVLGNEQETKTNASVMLLPTTVANGTWITLEQDGKWTNQRLARLIETTDSFSQYLLVPPE